MARWLYQVLTGRRSRTIVECRQRRRARDPRTFNEKITYKMTWDARPILSVFADKVAVRDYVRTTVGASILTHAYAIVDTPGDVPWSDLPLEYVCKVSHASGGNILVWKGAPEKARIPRSRGNREWRSIHVRPQEAHPELVGEALDSWLRQDYSWQPGRSSIERCYEGIRPRILIEERLSVPSGELPSNYRFFMFNGRCRAIVVDHSLPDCSRNDVLTPEWTRMRVVKQRTPWSSELPERPANLDECIEVAEALSHDVDFVRVDLYSVAGRIVFGEMTNYPSGGHNRFSPASFDALWGSWLTLDDYGPPLNDQGHSRR